jgi:UDP-N-acetylmuramoylalanine--D-glutamate ligase
MIPAAGQTALVIGLAQSGVAVVNFLCGRGVKVRIADLLPAEKLTDRLGQVPEAAELRLGGYGPEVLEACAAVFASPGVPWDDPILDRARELGLPVSSEIDLFFRLCPAPIIGVTGTNGKTTTTALIGSVLDHGPRPVMVGGNIGETVLDRLAEVTDRHLVVLELSSFQLESIERPRPWISVVLNVTPDHLDRHHSMAEYVEAKARILAFQTAEDHALLNSADPICRKLAERTRAEVLWFDRHQPVPPMPMPGRHNLQNALAAASVARIAGFSDEDIATAIASFAGVEHRLELVGSWNGIRWYNDSKATNPDASRMALEAFEGEPIVLIAGGYGGGFDLGPWAEEVRGRVESVILIGASAGEIAQRLFSPPSEGQPPDRLRGIHQVRSLEDAVQAAARAARPGSVVLLSPAYKSFDMFNSYEERGRRFKEAVLDLHRSRS